MRKIHVWCPAMFGPKGGIETYSLFLVTALGELVPADSLSIFIKNDRAEEVRGRARHHVAGSLPVWIRTLAFSLLIVGHAVFARPSLIITTHINFSPVAGWLSRFLRIPYWVVAHGVETWSANRAKILALDRASRVIAVSSHTAKVVTAELGIPEARVRILPNTFDEQKFRPGPKPLHLLKRYGIDPATPVILTLGRLSGAERHKGYDRILQALPQVRLEVPNIHYVLAGTGDDLPRIQGLIADLGLQKCVTLTGFVEEAGLCDHYNLCDAFVMLSKWEGFGIVFLEALACGKPVLAGNKDGSVDALLHGELGILIDPFNIPEIARTIVDLVRRNVSHPILYLPDVLRERVIDAYGLRKFKETLSGLLSECYDKSSGRETAPR